MKRFLACFSVMLLLSGIGNLQAADITPLKEGAAVPQVRLKDQDGVDFDFQSLRGKAVVLTFIYSRCAVPTFCPTMSKNFQELQQEIRKDKGLDGRVHLVSVSIDPSFDTPEILKGYANHFALDTKDWSFVTGDERTVAGLAGAFSVFIDQAADGSVDHTLTTALIAPDGKIAKLWRGNKWTSEDVIKALHAIPTTGEGTAAPEKDSQKQ